MLTVEKQMALGASILFFPEGKAVQAGGTCSSAAIPDPADPGWVDFQRVESWDYSRKDVKYEAVKDGSTGRLQLADEEETDGYNEYKFTTNAVLAYILGVFFRSQALLDKNATQFNPDQAETPRGWIIIDKRDANGNLIFAANLWGRAKVDALKGGGGSLTKPEVLFTQYKNALNTMSIGS